MGQSFQHGISTNFDALPDTALIAFPIVSAVTGWRRTKIHTDVKRGAFPAPLKLGARTARWRVGDIRAYLQRLGQQAAQ